MKNLIIILLVFFSYYIANAINFQNYSLDNQKLGFIENKGQIVDQFGNLRNDIRFMFNQGKMKVELKNNNFSYELYTKYIIQNKKKNKINSNNPYEQNENINYNINSHRVDIDLLGANPNPQIIAEGKSYDYSNYYLAYTPTDGICNVHRYSKITYKNVYPDIDLVYYLNSENKVKYDFVIRPGASVSYIKLQYTGADKLELTDEGILRIKTSQGTINEHIPLSYYQTTKSNKLNSINKIKVNYQLHNNIITFSEKENIPKNSTLIVDPELFWGTYYGSHGTDVFFDLAVDSKDDIYCVGYTDSDDNIATSGSHQSTYGGKRDAMLVKFNNHGIRQWATYYGGNENDYGQSILVSQRDNILIAGYTNSTSAIASSGSYQSTFGGGVNDGFIAKFNPNGSRDWGTYYGGSNYDAIFGIAMDSSRNTYVVGKTYSLNNIASADGYQNYKQGIVDAFVVKFDSSMTRVWGTYFGGNDHDGSESGTDIAADRAGNCYFTGYTSSDFSISTKDSYQENFGGDYDAYITKFLPNGHVHWSSYYGGSGRDYGRSVSTYGNGKVYLAGSTESTNNIASNDAFQKTLGGGYDAFVVKFDVYGDRKWGTYYGGDEDDLGATIAKYSFDQCALLGYTLSTSDIATPGEHQTSLAHNPTDTAISEDAFVVRFNTDGERQWASYYGGDVTEKLDYGGIGHDSKGNLIISGATQSQNKISTQNSQQESFVGDSIWSEDPDTGEMVYGGAYFDAYLAMFGTRITINNFTDLYCIGSDIAIPFSLGLDFESDNIFTAQLSDSTGDFTAPFVIGTLNSPSAGTIDGFIADSIPPGNHYRVRIVASNPENISADNGFDITIAPLPTPEITGDTLVCSRHNLIYSVSTDTNFVNQWYITNGVMIGDSTLPDVEVVWNDQSMGNLKVIQTNTITNCIDSTEQDVEITIAPIPYFTGKSTVAAYSNEIYSAKSYSKIKYEWLVIGGQIDGDTTNNSIYINWDGPGIGYIRLKQTNITTLCSDTISMNVTINSSPLKITGKDVVCSKSNENYSIPTPDNTTNLWKATNGEIQGTDSDSSVTVLWGDPGDGFVSLIQTDTITSKIDTVVLHVDVIPIPNVGILGTNEVCETSTFIYYALNTENLTNQWSVYNGSIVGSDSGDTIVVDWNSIPQGVDSTIVKASVKLTQTDNSTGCSNTKLMLISVGKNPSAEFIGNTSVCTGRVETYTVVDIDAIINEWSVTGGSIIGSSKDTTIQIEWGKTGVGRIKLFQTSINYCSDSSVTDIIINDVPPQPEITQSGKVLISSSETGNQWFLNDKIIQGANDKFYMPDTSGYYTVHVINANGCASDMSKPLYFELNISVKDFAASKNILSLYPNPTNGLLHLEFKSNSINPALIQIRNIIGDLVYEIKNANINQVDKNIDISDLPAGVYILQIQINENYYNYKVIKY